MNCLTSSVTALIDISFRASTFTIFFMWQHGSFFYIENIPDHKPNSFLFISRDFCDDRCNQNFFFIFFLFFCIDIFLICAFVNI